MIRARWYSQLKVQSTPAISHAKSALGRLMQGPLFLTSGCSLFVKGTVHAVSLWADSRNNGPLTKRRDIRHVIRVKKDWAIIFPALLYAILPFTIPTIPFIVAKYPSVLPSAFVTDELMAKRIAGIEKKRSDKSAVLAGFRKACSELPIPFKNQLMTNSKKLMIKALSGKYTVSNSDLFDLYPFIYTHFNLLSLPNESLIEFSRFLCLALPSISSRSKIIQWADWILKDDALIRAEPRNLTQFELLEILDERGLFC